LLIYTLPPNRWRGAPATVTLPIGIILPLQVLQLSQVERESHQPRMHEQRCQWQWQWQQHTQTTSTRQGVNINSGIMRGSSMGGAGGRLTHYLSYCGPLTLIPKVHAGTLPLPCPVQMKKSLLNVKVNGERNRTRTGG
jgi:hypothetical protein